MYEESRDEATPLPLFRGPFWRGIQVPSSRLSQVGGERYHFSIVAHFITVKGHIHPQMPAFYYLRANYHIICKTLGKTKVRGLLFKQRRKKRLSLSSLLSLSTCRGVLLIFNLWQNTHSVAFTVLAIFKCPVQWREAHSRSWAAVPAAVPRTFSSCKTKTLSPSTPTPHLPHLSPRQSVSYFLSPWMGPL